VRRVGRVMAWLYTWFFFMPIFAAATFVFGIGAILLSLVSRRVGSLCGVAWGRVVLATAGLRVRVVGRERFDRRRQYVVMANHRSHFDAPLLYGWLGFRFLWVMKKELRRAPVLGPACARVGHIFIDRRDHAQAVAALREGLARSAGASVLFFPEGTRSPDRNLLPFKKGGFALAAEAGLPILPVTVTGTERALSARRMIVFPFRRVVIRFHAPIFPPASSAPEARDAFLEAVRARIASGLEGPANGVRAETAAAESEWTPTTTAQG